METRDLPALRDHGLSPSLLRGEVLLHHRLFPTPIFPASGVFFVLSEVP